MKLTLTSESLALLKEKAKLYSNMARYFKELYFKLTAGNFELILKGKSGALKTVLPTIDSDITSDYYFGIDYQKWTNAIQKYGPTENIQLEIKKDTLYFLSQARTGTITLALTPYKAGSSTASVIDNLINKTLEDCTRELPLTTDFLEKTGLMNSLFIPQIEVNAVGVNKTSLMNNTRIILGKTYLSDPVPDAFFGTNDPENYVYIHTFFLGLLPLLTKTSASLMFDANYSTVGWQDEDTAFVMRSEPCSACLPSPDEWDALIPDPGQKFEVSLSELKDTLQFFDGFYESGDWKPITFRLSANKAVELVYDHPTTIITQDLSSVPDFDAEFMVDAGALSKVLAKVQESSAEDLQLTFTCGPDSEAVYMEAGADYKFLLAVIQGSTD